MTQSCIAPPVGKFSLRHPGWLSAALITFVIIGFHFYFLAHAGGLWRDEVNFLNVARRHSLAEMARDSFPLFMPLAVKFFCAAGFGQAEIYLRLLGIFIGLGCVAGLWAAAWQSRRSPPLISLVLFGLNSTMISFGDSLRPYGLGCLFVIFTMAGIWFFLKQTSWPRAGLVAVLAVLSVQTLFHDAVLIGAACLGTVAVCLRRKDWLAAFKILLAGAVAALSLAPYLGNFFDGRESTAVLHTGVSWLRFFNDLATDLGFPWRPYMFVWALLALVVLVLGFCGFFKPRPVPETSGALTQDEPYLFAATTLLLSVGGFLLFLRLTGMPGQPWYFLPLMALTAMCFDMIVPALPGLVRCVLLGGLLATTIISIPVCRRDLNYRFTNIDDWSHSLAKTAAREDFIIVTPWFYGITFDHYFHGTTNWSTLPPLPDHATHRYDLVRGELQKSGVMRPVLDQAGIALQSGHRVWLLAPAGVLRIPAPGTPPPPDLPPAPLPDTGWSDEPYSVAWTFQAMQFLSDHSRSFVLVSNPGTSQHTAENMELFLAQGWHESGSATNSNAK